MKRAGIWVMMGLAIAGAHALSVGADMQYTTRTHEYTATRIERPADQITGRSAGTFIPGGSSRPGASISGPLAQTGWALEEPMVTMHEETVRSIEQRERPIGRSETTETRIHRRSTEAPQY